MRGVRLRRATAVTAIVCPSRSSRAAAVRHRPERERRGRFGPVRVAAGDAVRRQVKAIAIARKYLLDETPKIDLLVTPRFEQDIRSGSNVVFDIQKARPIKREPTEDDLSAKEKTDAFKLAGAIAGATDGYVSALTARPDADIARAFDALAFQQAGEIDLLARCARGGEEDRTAARKKAVADLEWLVRVPCLAPAAERAQRRL